VAAAVAHRDDKPLSDTVSISMDLVYGYHPAGQHIEGDERDGDASQ